jgi:pyrroline-5-carboxylate reductase
MSEQLGRGAGTVLLVGAGNMGSALARAWISSGLSPERLCAHDKDEERVSALSRELGCLCADSVPSALEIADTVVLAVKPQNVDAVGAEICGTNRRFTLLSILAGVRTGLLESLLGECAGVVRAMPNLAVTVGAGVSAMVGGRSADEGDMRRAERLLGAAGPVLRLDDESLMDVVTAVSGSGPAYYFLLTEALAAAGEALGLEPRLAARLAEGTAHGAGRLLATGEADPAEWRRRVTSKGGTTERALEIFESGEFRALVRRAVEGAASRSRELSGD